MNLRLQAEPMELVPESTGSAGEPGYLRASGASAEGAYNNYSLGTTNTRFQAAYHGTFLPFHVHPPAQT